VDRREEKGNNYTLKGATIEVGCRGRGVTSSFKKKKNFYHGRKKGRMVLRDADVAFEHFHKMIRPKGKKKS